MHKIHGGKETDDIIGHVELTELDLGWTQDRA